MYPTTAPSRRLAPCLLFLLAFLVALSFPVAANGAGARFEGEWISVHEPFFGLRIEDNGANYIVHFVNFAADDEWNSLTYREVSGILVPLHTDYEQITYLKASDSLDALFHIDTIMHYRAGIVGLQGLEDLAKRRFTMQRVTSKLRKEAKAAWAQFRKEADERAKAELAEKAEAEKKERLRKKQAEEEEEARWRAESLLVADDRSVNNLVTPFFIEYGLNPEGEKCRKLLARIHARVEATRAEDLRALRHSEVAELVRVPGVRAALAKKLGEQRLPGGNETTGQLAVALALLPYQSREAYLLPPGRIEQLPASAVMYDIVCLLGKTEQRMARVPYTQEWVALFDPSGAIVMRMTQRVGEGVAFDEKDALRNIERWRITHPRLMSADEADALIRKINALPGPTAPWKDSEESKAWERMDEKERAKVMEQYDMEDTLRSWGEPRAQSK